MPRPHCERRAVFFRRGGCLQAARPDRRRAKCPDPRSLFAPRTSPAQRAWRPIAQETRAHAVFRRFPRV